MRKEDHHYEDPWDRDFYGTGSTNPPKQHGGIIAVLLVLVILLGGVCSAMGILNFRLLQQLAHGEQKHQTLEIFDGSTGADLRETIAADGSRLPWLGITGQTVSDFDRRYYELPPGVLVTDVAEEHCAWAAGIRPGDVIVTLDGRMISTQEALTLELEQLQTGQQVKMEVYRSQTRERFTATVKISEE